MPRMAPSYPGMGATTGRRLRAMLAARPRALLTDVDGTISAIAPTPEAARLLPGVADLLIAATRVFDVVAVISGRAAQDARRLVGVPGLTYIGNHGMERIDPGSAVGATPAVEVMPAAQPFVASVGNVLDDIERSLAPRFAGMIVERKGVTGSIHYRLTTDPTAAQAAITERLGVLPSASSLRITHGKRVVEIRPPIAIDKGTTLRELVAARGLRGAIYLGDDHTDVDAFRALRALSASGTFHGFAVAIPQAEAPADLAASADFALPSIERVPAFLAWLLDRARPET